MIGSELGCESDAKGVAHPIEEIDGEESQDSDDETPFELQNMPIEPLENCNARTGIIEIKDLSPTFTVKDIAGPSQYIFRADIPKKINDYMDYFGMLSSSIPLVKQRMHMVHVHVVTGGSIGSKSNFMHFLQLYLL